jgi:hypothetical protein
VIEDANGHPYSITSLKQYPEKSTNDLRLGRGAFDGNWFCCRLVGRFGIAQSRAFPGWDESIVMLGGIPEG